MSEKRIHLPKQLLHKDQTEYPPGLYNRFPAFELDHEEINQGYKFLVQLIQQKIPQGLRVLVIDGFPGVHWQSLIDRVSPVLSDIKIDVTWRDVKSCLADSGDIRTRIEPFMGGDDRTFGTHYPFGPELFFNAKKIADFRIEASIARGDKAGNLTIFFGCGSGLLELWDQLWYLDFPKDLAQELAKRGEVSNLGEPETPPFEQFYKRAYFIEWPAFNRLKSQLLPQLDLIIDFQNVENSTSTMFLMHAFTQHRVTLDLGKVYVPCK